MFTFNSEKKKVNLCEFIVLQNQTKLYIFLVAHNNSTKIMLFHLWSTCFCSSVFLLVCGRTKRCRFSVQEQKAQSSWRPDRGTFYFWDWIIHNFQTWTLKIKFEFNIIVGVLDTGLFNLLLNPFFIYLFIYLCGFIIL